MTHVLPGEKIIETKTCRISGEEFVVTDKDLEFYDTVSPVFAGQKYNIPSPTLSPDERKRRRMMFRNNRFLYFTAAGGGLSMFRSEGGYIGYEPPKYWSDDWSAHDFARGFDFSRTAFDQFADLNKQVPKIARSVVYEQNCDYINHAGHTKDCYLIFGGNYAEECYYGNRFLHAKNCIDFLGAYGCEKCYEIVDCVDCYGVLFSQECTNCRDSAFLYACSDCSNCFGCINLRSKSFCIFNQQYSETQYHQKISQLQYGSQRAAIDTKVQKLFAQHPRREHTNTHCESCIGNKIMNSQNIYSGYLIAECRDLRYCDELARTQNCYDITSFGEGVEFSYEGVVLGMQAGRCLFTSDCWENISDLLYCMHCNKNVHSCFLSTGLRKAKHCILNTALSTQEYETQGGKIVDHMRSTGEWGEFFSHELSPFGYNETIAQEYFPMQPDIVRENNWTWHDAPRPSQSLSKMPYLSIQSYDEKEVESETAKKNIDVLLSSTLVCESTGKPFKIIPQELAFYIEQGLPIPTKHPDQRHNDRLAKRNPRRLWERNCDKCGSNIQTTYDSVESHEVYCEECYRAEVY